MRSNQSLQDVLGLAAAVRQPARNERRSRRAPEPSVAKDRRLVAVPAHSAPDEEAVAGLERGRPDRRVLELPAV
jgi:hypothetical protein